MSNWHRLEADVLDDREKRESCGQVKLYKTSVTRRSIISSTNIQTRSAVTSNLNNESIDSNISSLVRCLRCFGRTSLHSHSNGWDRRDRAESSGTTHTEDCPSNRGLHTHTSS